MVRGNDDSDLAAALMDNSPAGGNTFRCRAYSSSDGALSWSDRGFLSIHSDTDRSADPVVATDTNGNLFIVCIATDDPDFDPSDVLYWISTNGGVSWTGPTDVVHSTGGVIFHDKPWVAADTEDPSSPFRNNVYVCWTKYDDPVGKIKIMFKRIWPNAGPIKTVATGNWGTADPSNGEATFCQVAVGKLGIVYVTWQRLVTTPTGGDTGTAKIQLKRSFDGGNSLESTSQPVKTFNRFPETKNNCPSASQYPRLWGCLQGIPGSGIQAPAIHSIAIDAVDWNVHVAFSDYVASSTLADIKYTKGTNCITAGVTCSWSFSQRITKDGSNAVDQWDPAITVSPDSNTIHVTAMDRRNSASNEEWKLWHYHCHLSGTTCESSTHWTAIDVTSEMSDNFDSLPFIGEYHGITSSAAREADTVWSDTRVNSGTIDYNIFGNRLTTS